MCATICGADNWVAWFRAWYTSHDTFGEVYAAIDTDHFSVCFSRLLI